jgi:hypothetical protein
MRRVGSAQLTALTLEVRSALTTVSAEQIRARATIGARGGVALVALHPTSFPSPLRKARACSCLDLTHPTSRAPELSPNPKLSLDTGILGCIDDAAVKLQARGPKVAVARLFSFGGGRGSAETKEAITQPSFHELALLVAR